MKLSDIFAALAAIESNGEEMKNFLKSFLSEKDTSINTLESKANALETQLKSVSTALGVEKTDDINEAIKAVKEVKKDIEAKNKQLETLSTENTQLKTKVSDMERQESMSVFASVVGADRDVLLDLLPPDIKLEIEEVEDNGKKRKRGIVLEGNNKIDFIEFVDSDQKLSKFKPAIFTQEQNPPQTPPKLPSGKSSSKPPSTGSKVTQSILEARKARAEKIKAKFN